jgi:dimethylglycine dehydrogenase
MAERYHQRYFNMVELPDDTTLDIATNRIAGFNVAGPKSRELLQYLTNADLTNEQFRFMRSRTIDVAGVTCLAIRVSFTGDLGWELHCAEKDQVQLYTALLDAAEKCGGGAVGGRALSSLRIEKGYGSWGREYSQEYWPQEVGLDGLIKLDKDFLHKDAYLKIKENTPRTVLSIFEIDVSHDADASGGEPIFTPDGKPVGFVTSGAYGYSVEKSLAIGSVNPAVVSAGDTVEVFILGKPHKARMLETAPFDPDGQRLRH